MGQKQVLQGNETKKHMNSAILISLKIEFNPDFISIDKEGHIILIKEQSAKWI